MSKDTIVHLADSLIKEPVTYLNTATGIISFMAIEEGIKIFFYIVSIVASILVSYKYLLEIKKLKKQNSNGKSTK